MLVNYIHELDDEVVKLKAISKSRNLDDNPPIELTVCLSHLMTLIRDMQEIIRNSHTHMHTHEEAERFFDHHIK